VPGTLEQWNRLLSGLEPKLAAQLAIAIVDRSPPPAGGIAADRRMKPPHARQTASMCSLFALQAAEGPFDLLVVVLFK
jgi:hypothetical protein